jgi:hypothetical protein
MRATQSLLFTSPLHLFLFILVASILTIPSLAKGRATGSSLSSASAYTLDLLQPHPNQRVYGISDSAGDVFLSLKFAAPLQLLQLLSLIFLFMLFFMLFFTHFYVVRFTVHGGKEGDGLVAKLFLPAENKYSCGACICHQGLYE